MPGLGPNCCCTPPPPPYCCDLKSVDRWEIEAVDHTPSGCCELYEGTYYPDPALSSGCEYRRIVEFPDPIPCVDGCSIYTLGGVTYYVSIKRITIWSVLQNGMGNVSPLSSAFTSLDIDYLVYRSTGYSSCVADAPTRRSWSSQSGVCDNFPLTFFPNFVSGFGFSRVFSCNDLINEKFFKLTTVLV